MTKRAGAAHVRVPSVAGAGVAAATLLLAACLLGCSGGAGQVAEETGEEPLIISDAASEEDEEAEEAAAQAEADAQAEAAAEAERVQVELDAAVDETRAALDLTEDLRASLSHGDKPASCQKYIVMHDTEGTSSAASVIDWWDSNGNLVGAHFVVNTDGSVWQCVPLDQIAHHAGYGDAGHNELFGISEDGRDDMLGTTPIGSWAPDYGMNAWSVGIEMVHVGGQGGYTEAQLDAVDALIAYIDAYYAARGLEDGGQIIDHKAWRTGNSDTSAEFAGYLANLQDRRTTR